MRKPFLLLLIPLALALASAQTQNPPSPSPSPAAQSTPGNNAGSIYGNTTPSGSGGAPAPATPLPGTTATSPGPVAQPSQAKPGSATDASGGGVAGQAGTGSGVSQVPETPTASAAAGVSDNDLQSQIENALSKEPTLSGDSLHVTVSEDAIEMHGTVATAREKQTASRIVQSYAGNRKVVIHVTVGSHSSGAPSAHVPNRPPSAPSAALASDRNNTLSSVSQTPPQ